MECSMPYRADVSQPDPSLSIISKCLAEPDPQAMMNYMTKQQYEIAQQSAVSQFAKMLIMDYHSVCTALLLFLTVATAERPFSKLKLIKTYLSSMGQNGLTI